MDESESEPSSHEQMERYEELAEREREFRAEKRSVLDGIGEDLATVIEGATEQTGTNVEVDATSSDGTVQRFSARLDRAALVATVCDTLPSGFAVKDVNDDGSLSIEWSRRERSPEQRATAILKAIVNEELVTDADDLIVEAPSRSAVVDRATELDVPRGLADERLDRLADLGMVEIEGGQVFPDS